MAEVPWAFTKTVPAWQAAGHVVGHRLVAAPDRGAQTERGGVGPATASSRSP